MAPPGQPRDSASHSSELSAKAAEPGSADKQQEGQPGKDAFIDASINLRDLTAALPATCACAADMRRGRVYRCSQLHTPEIRAALGVRCVLDLRKTGKACQRASLKHRTRSVLRPQYWLVKARGMMPMGLPARCPVCEFELNRGAEDGEGVQVFHVDMSTSGFKASVLRGIPCSDAAAAITTALTGGNPDGPMANVVADDGKLGLGALYILYLEHSKRQVKKAFKVLAAREAYPALVHCIHGKDRTGLLAMLLLSVCGADADSVARDFEASAVAMGQWAARPPPELPADYVTTKMLSVQRRNLDMAMGHIDGQYGGAAAYLRKCGVGDAMQARVRANLMRAAA